MALELLAIDLGKRAFHIYGIDTDGVILSRKGQPGEAGSPPAAKCVSSILVS